MLSRLACRYGQRGACLIVLGSAWFILGVGIAIDPQPPHSWVLYESVPPLVQAAAWWISGLVAVTFGLRGREADDRPGHVALYVMPALRVLCFTFSWLVWLVSSFGYEAGWWSMRIGWTGGWYAALIWGLFSLMLRLIAEWPNPRVMVPPPPGGDQGLT
jgi:hypothetical protein